MNQTVFPAAEPPKHSGRDWSYSDKTGWSGVQPVERGLYEDDEEFRLGSKATRWQVGVYAVKGGGGFLAVVAMARSTHNVTVANLSSLLSLLTMMKPLTEVKRATK